LDVAINLSVGFDDAWGIQAYDIGIVISNLLDNAIKATVAYHDGSRTIAFSIVEKAPVIIITCENPYYAHDVKLEEPKLWHGLGLKNVEAIATRYNGTMKVDQNDGRFINRVMLKKTI